MGGVTLFLALVLAGAAAHKVAAWRRLGIAAARLAGTAVEQGMLLLAVAGSIEVIAALALLIPSLHGLGVVLAAALWAVYAAALFRRRGETLDCGCDLMEREKPVGSFAIIRPFVLAGLALLTLAVPGAGWSVETPFAALAMLALYVAASELAGLPPLSKSLRKGTAR